MTTSRLEAFSDGVLAIVITIMVLELKVPEGVSFAALKPLIPKFMSYTLSFIYLGIYWNNHHHHFHAVKKINGKVLWANLLLLFFLSLIPFTTDWLGESNFAKNPAALYGTNLLACNIAVWVLQTATIKVQGNETITAALKNHTKEYLSSLLYIVGVILSFFVPNISVLCYAAVAAIWLIPDKRIEKALQE
jgi:uncharacterized membrane protein